MKRVHWTSQETEQVLTKAMLLMDRAYPPFEAIKQAQVEELPASRQRSLKAHASCFNLIKEVKSRHATAIKQKFPEPPKPPSLPTAFVPSLESTLDDMAAQLAAQFAVIFKAKVRSAVLELTEDFKLSKHDPSYTGSRDSKPRIIVIGLLDAQEKMIEREFGGVFDLKCLSSDRASGLTPPDADAYLLMKNFINHPLYYKYRAFQNHVLIDGGMTALRTWLHARANQLIKKPNQDKPAD